MTVKKQKLHSILIIIYVVLVMTFFGYSFIGAYQKPKPTSYSQISSLSTNELETITDVLYKRAQIEPLEPIDLSSFEFGITEPFQP